MSQASPVPRLALALWLCAAAPAWADPAWSLPPKTKPAPPILSQAEVEHRIALDEASQRHCLVASGLGVLVGAAAFGVLKLGVQAGNGDQENFALMAVGSTHCLAGAVFAVGGLLCWANAAADKYRLKTRGRPLIQSRLDVAPVLLAQGRAPGLGVTARF